MPENLKYNTKLPSTGYIRLPNVLEIIPVSASTWWAGSISGRFPKPIKLTPRTTAWKVEEIRALIDSYNIKDGEVNDASK